MTSLVRSTGWLSLAWGVQMATGLLSQPLLNRNLSESERGLVALCTLVLAISFEAIRLGADRALVYLVASREEPDGIVGADLVWNAAAAVVVLCVAVSLPVVTASLPSPVVLAVSVVAWAAVIPRGLATFAGVDSAQHRFGTVALGIASGAVWLLASRALLVPKYGVVGEFASMGTSVVVGYLPSLVGYLRRHGVARPSRQDFLDLGRFAREASGSLVGAALGARGVPLVIYPIVGTGPVGVYSAMVGVASVLVSASSLVVRPLHSRSATMNDDEARRVLAPVARLLVAGTSALSIGLAAVAPWLVEVLGAESYSGAVPVFRLLVLQTPIRVLGAACGVHLSGSGHPRLESRAAMVGAVAALAFATLGALLAGLPGAIVGETVAAVLQLVVLLSATSSKRGLRWSELLVPRFGDFRMVLVRLRSMIR